MSFNDSENNNTSTAGNALRIFFSCLIVYAFFTNDYLTTNDASRFSLTAAIVDTGGPEITNVLPRVISPGWKIRDFARSGDRIFSDKAPLGSFLAVPVYFIASRAGLPLNWIVFFVSLFTTGVCTALTAVLIYEIVQMLVDDERRAVTIALVYGLGTMALFYGTVFFSSAITACCGLASFYCLARVQAGRGAAGLAAAGGLLAGAAVLSDYYAAITAVCLLGYAVAGRRYIAQTLLGFAVAVSLLLLYNTWAFGAPWPLSYSYSYLYDQLHSTGFYGISLPSAGNATRLIRVLFSGWGFFFTNIVVVFSIAGFRRFMLFRRQAAMVLFMALGYLYFNSCESWLDAYSARFFMPLLPFLMLPLTFIDFSNRWLRNAFCFLSGFSLIINFGGADRFLREFMGAQYRPGMNNLAGAFLGSRGIDIGFFNFIFPLIIILFVWFIPSRKPRITTDK